jgi:hypothetical protein
MKKRINIEEIEEQIAGDYGNKKKQN